MNDGTHVVASADVCGIYGNGSSVEEAVEDFCMAIKTRLTNNLGGRVQNGLHWVRSIFIKKLASKVVYICA